MWKILAGRCIYHSSTNIRVFQNFFFRWLKFEGAALQTVINRYLPHRPELHYVKTLILAAQLQPANCCMLGLGGGGAAHALSALLGNFQLAVVENNSEVIDIAKCFFMLNKLRNIHIIHQDASLFVQQSNVQFQHLLVDLSNAETFPQQCNTEQFFANCKHLLLAGGIMAVNLANKHEQWSIFKLIRQQFLSATVALPVKNCTNVIILACKSETVTPLLERLKRSKKLKRLAWDTKWGCIAEM
jgi:spermidine synthase